MNRHEGKTEEELIFPFLINPLHRAQQEEQGHHPNHQRSLSHRPRWPWGAGLYCPAPEGHRPPDDRGSQPHHYWPFATSDLYNWRSQNAPFSENPRALTNLLETVLFTHQPTWDDCQQLLQVLFTIEEGERIQSEARKLVPGPTGVPTTDQAQIDAGFLLAWPDWDYNSAEGPPLELHRFCPGDWVYVKRDRQANLEPRRKGPYTVLLTTPTALKVDGVATWIYYTHSWPADPFTAKEDYRAPDPQWKATKNLKNPLKLKLCCS
ncbi:uncharacterized protein LOC120239151 [Hyaena hyaena]|uniref:uncharacterized protein LOC120239151 n=1 Tax=Hyaena hyaena TaxID=95912 RepID=UPI0019221157|nr:uncharacterized protein LOC120239151 [Hyaena hyaena]